MIVLFGVLRALLSAGVVVGLTHLATTPPREAMAILEDGVAAASAQTRAKIVALAQSPVGYTTDPSTTYCNRFRAFWVSGPAQCGNSHRDEQWCADFAAWTWCMAGVPLVNQYINGEINSSSASFYKRVVRHHTWHPVTSNDVPRPGDVAVYGLDVLIAQHVVIVVSDTPTSAGPNAIAGDGDQTRYSRVEYRANQYSADAEGTGVATLAGDVLPSA